MDGSRAMRLLSLLIGLGAPVASRTDAAQLTISNAGFESPQLVDGQ